MSIFDHTEQTKIDYLISYFRENKDLTFEEVFEKLKTESKFEWLIKLKIKDIFKYKDLKVIKKEHVEDIEEYEKKVIKFLEDNGVGESGRGFSTTEILNDIGGNQNTLRNLLNVLFENNTVFSTGETQGKKWVLGKFKKLAIKNYNR